MTFILGRQIHDNVIVGHEVFHFLKCKKGSMAVKLDLNKAYDRVCWDFLIKVLERMGFSDVWIRWIKDCVCMLNILLMPTGSKSATLSNIEVFDKAILYLHTYYYLLQMCCLL